MPARPATRRPDVVVQHFDAMQQTLRPFLTGIALVAMLALTGSVLTAHDWPQWRGPQRNGHSIETGLLPAWPAEGPKLEWRVSGIGSGYAAPAVAGDRLYLLANEGFENEFVQALSAADGRRVWSTRLGNVGNPDQEPPFAAARSTPTVEGEVLYALGSDGDLACLETATGRLHWQRNLRRDFDGQPGAWAYSESPLIDGDLLICSPGGSRATVIALRKQTGQVVWQTALPEADTAAYASATVVEFGGIRQVVQLLEKGLVGIEAGTGRFLWRYPRATSRFRANIPSPVAHEDTIYCGSAGTGGGAVRLRMLDNTFTAEELYFEAKMPTAIGGVVRIGDHLYGTTGQALLCLEFATGRLLWEERAIGAAALCVADGRLYLRGENGQVALADPSPDGYRERGRFRPPDQPERLGPMEKAWAYPAIANGRLYLRDHGTLWSYNIRATQ